MRQSSDLRDTPTRFWGGCKVRLKASSLSSVFAKAAKSGGITWGLVLLRPYPDYPPLGDRVVMAATLAAANVFRQRLRIDNNGDFVFGEILGGEVAISILSYKLSLSFLIYMRARKALLGLRTSRPLRTWRPSSLESIPPAARRIIRKSARPRYFP